MLGGRVTYKLRPSRNATLLEKQRPKCLRDPAGIAGSEWSEFGTVNKEALATSVFPQSTFLGDHKNFDLANCSIQTDELGTRVGWLSSRFGDQVTTRHDSITTVASSEPRRFSTVCDRVRIAPEDAAPASKSQEIRSFPVFRRDAMRSIVRP